MRNSNLPKKFISGHVSVNKFAYKIRIQIIHVDLIVHIPYNLHTQDRRLFDRAKSIFRSRIRAHLLIRPKLFLPDENFIKLNNVFGKKIDPM